MWKCLPCFNARKPPVCFLQVKTTELLKSWSVCFPLTYVLWVVAAEEVDACIHKWSKENIVGEKINIQENLGSKYLK